MSNLLLTLTVSSRVRELGQLQLRVPHSQVVGFLQAAGAPEKTALSRKKGKILYLTIRTPKGAEIELTQADTHAVWIQHNQGDAAKLLNWAYQNGGAQFEVINARYEDTSGGAASQATIEMEDCPF